MSASNPQVSVFHFTSRISSAKIKKYKLATERGMTGPGSAREETPNSTSMQPSASPSLEAASMEPPAKKAKLKLSVRQPNDSPDTITVKPRQDSSLRIRYSENMVLEGRTRHPVPKPSPAPPSELSSLPSTQSIESERAPVAEAPPPAPSRPRDYSRDFMSYYIAGGDEDEVEQKTAQPAPQPPQVIPQKRPPPKEAHAPAQTAQPHIHVQAPPHDARRKKHHMPQHVQPPPHQPARIPHPRHPPPQAVVHIIDNIKKSEPTGRDTVASMIKKLEALSSALINFGKAPGPNQQPSQSPSKQTQDTPKPTGEKKEKEIDNFLAMFDEEEDDEKDEEEDEKEDDAEQLLQHRGEPDSPLTHGIQFIQNALRSWAHQRLTMQYTQQLQSIEQQRLQNESQPQKRGPGRPRKFDNGDEHHSFMAPPPSSISVELLKTPEGVAVAAFQEVLNSAVLQVNAILPIELSRALRHLYMQIDRLINQGANNEPKWQYMSYGAQIAAHKGRVENWKSAQAEAQEELAKQQHLSEQRMLQQMGIPVQKTLTISPEQAQQQHAIDLERKRSAQHAAQQPHLSPYLTKPLQLNTQQTGNVRSPSTTQPASASSPGVSAATVPSNAPEAQGSQSSPADPKAVQLDKIKLYMPNYLPRSGQSMKFSFAPQSELALKAFGAQAFPTQHTGPNIPNRGPMSTHPRLPTSGPMNPPRLPNGHQHPPTLVSNAPSPNSAGMRPHHIDTATANASRSASRPLASSPLSSSVNGSVTPKLPSSNPSHIDAVNRQSAFAHLNAQSMIASSPKTTSVPASPAQANGEGKGTDLAARFPHPGAVIVDE